MKLSLYLTLSFFYMMMGIATSQIIPAKKNTQWGAVTATQKIIIPFRFKKVDFYTKNYLLVTTQDNKKGLYSYNGKLVLKSEYDAITPLNNTYFQVYNQENTGIITNLNTTIIPIDYTSIAFDSIHKNFIVSKNAKYGILNAQGKIIVPLHYDNISLYNNNGYLLRKGKQFAFTHQLEKLESLIYADDLIGLEQATLLKKDNRWGVQAITGKISIPIKYESIKPFGKEYLLVKKDKEYGIFDANGKQSTPFIYNQPFYTLLNATIWTKKNDQWVSVNLKNAKEQLLPYEKVLDSVKGFFRVIKDNHVLLVDKNANTYFATNAYNDIEIINDSIFKVLKGRKWGVVTKQNDTIIPIQFDNITLFTPHKKENILALRYDIKTQQKDSVSKPTHLFLVENNFKKGVLDFNGNVLVPIKYDDIQLHPKDTILITNLEHLKGAVGISGTQLLKPSYQNIQWNEKQGTFVYIKDNSTYFKDKYQKSILLDSTITFSTWSNKKGLFFAEKNGKKGMLTTANKLLIPFNYTRLYDLDDNYCIGITAKGAKIFNAKGKEVSTNFYDAISIFYQDHTPIFIVKKNDKMGALNKQGKIIIPLNNYQLSVTHSLIKAENDGETLGYFDFSGTSYF